MILVTILLLREIISIKSIIKQRSSGSVHDDHMTKLIIMRIMINEATLPKEAVGPCSLEIRRR